MVINTCPNLYFPSACAAWLVELTGHLQWWSVREFVEEFAAIMHGQLDLRAEAVSWPALNAMQLRQGVSAQYHLHGLAAARSPGRPLLGFGRSPATPYFCMMCSHDLGFSGTQRALDRFRTNFQGQREIYFPQPVWPLVNEFVLVEDFVGGVPISHILKA